MSQSASLRERRRHETSFRISAEARRLTDAHGLDGWTMDELAAAADVSRRTLFNYFPGKIDAVLGEPPQVPDDLLATFQAGGPTGDLLEDIGVVIQCVLQVDAEDRESLELGRRLLKGTPRLLVAAHQRFEASTDEFAALLRTRSTADISENDARLLLRMLVALYDNVLERYLAEPPGRSFAELYADTLHAARRLLG
ncbi:TetR family transcriptional regulator [Nocardioides ferulae]|uniref:TetR family transcriptional regulator n=1 Tax=Nocardioides ferulae TaxID=2340821 RepID=UPI0013DDFADC|nr:TetR family transcriptional regulator [Nocardioides ferulae]